MICVHCGKPTEPDESYIDRGKRIDMHLACSIAIGRKVAFICAEMDWRATVGEVSQQWH